MSVVRPDDVADGGNVDGDGVRLIVIFIIQAVVTTMI